MKIPCVYLRNVRDVSGEVGVLDFPDDLDNFPDQPKKDDSPAWLPVTLGPSPVDIYRVRPRVGRVVVCAAGQTGRYDECVQYVHALVLDYDVDADGIPADVILDRWAGYTRTIHSTWTPGRWRVVLPYAHPHTPAEHARVYAWAIQREGALIDATCANPSRLFFLPCVSTSAGVDFEPTFDYAEGELLSVGVVPSDLRPAGQTTDSGSPRASGNQSPAPDGAPRPANRLAEGGGVAVPGPGAAVPGPWAAPYQGLSTVGQDRDLPLIESRCAFMARARDNAASLPEPEWYAALSVWARCKDGDALAHERSRPYSGYSQAETDEKLARAKEVGPATCAHIRRIAPSACAGCPLQITSPVLLGRVEVGGAGAGAADPSPGDAADTLAEVERTLAEAGETRAKALVKLEGTKRALALSRRLATAVTEAELEQAVRERAAAEGEARAAEAMWRKAEKAVLKLRAKLSASGLPAGADPATWAKLRVGQDNRPVDSVANVAHILQDDPRWVRRLSYDVFAQEVLLDGAPLPETEAVRVATELSDSYGLETTTPRVIECLSAAARRSSVDPLADYLLGLTWDGVERAPLLAFEGWGATNVTQSWQTELMEGIATRFLVSLVARGLKPGCKVDTMLVLTGPQGAYKSTVLEVLVPRREWFGRTKMDITNKDSYLLLRGRWLYEFAELSEMKRVEANTTKGWLSNEVDEYRAPYARRAESHPRRTVVVGTDNEGEFLKDPTGSRRYWPVPVASPNPSWIQEYRDQLLAEAVARYQRGEPWWFDEKSALGGYVRAWSSAFAEVDPWADTVADWLRTTHRQRISRFEVVTVNDIMTNALGMSVLDVSPRESQRVSRIVRYLGLVPAPQDNPSGTRERAATLYRRPDWLTLAEVAPLPSRTPAATVAAAGGSKV